MCCAILLLVALTACGTSGARGETSASLTTDTHSAQFATDAEKIAFLGRYITLYSAIEATEFHIVYHDNAGGAVPGPSDWDMRVALKVAPADVSAWTSGLEEIDSAGADLSWGTDLLPNTSRWARTSQPRIFQREGVIVAAFVSEGVILKHIWTT
ncbi:MAG TPA: hypothetical protein VH349_03150 [Ktedonobacterales bacterium]